MIEVIQPVAYVLFFSLVRDKLSEPVSLVILPLAFINVTVRAPKLTFAVCLVVKPFSLVLCLVLPDLNAICALASLLVDISCIVGLLHNFNVFNVL